MMSKTRQYHLSYVNFVLCSSTQMYTFFLIQFAYLNVLPLGKNTASEGKKCGSLILLKVLLRK